MSDKAKQRLVLTNLNSINIYYDSKKLLHLLLKFKNVLILEKGNNVNIVTIESRFTSH